MNTDIVGQGTELVKIAVDHALPIALQLVGAIVLWIVGSFVIRLLLKAVRRGLARSRVDSTLASYADATLNVLLKLLLIVAVLGAFGVQTTSFAALLAAAGLAIGTAWAGLLANFAAGVFLILLRPFKVGDFVSAGGVTGVVKEIGLFATSIDTPENVRTVVGNGKIFADNIQNYTTNPHRRVELRLQLAHGVDPQEAKHRLQPRVSAIPNVLSNPAPSIEILEFNAMGPVLAVRPFCHNDHYLDVYFAGNQAIQEVCSDAGYPAPEQHFVFRDKLTSSMIRAA